MNYISEYFDSIPIYIMIPLGILFVLFIIYMDFLDYNKGSEIEPYMPIWFEENKLEIERQELLAKANEIKERDNNE